MKDTSIVITGLGMISPVGIGVAQACGSIRAGISRFQESLDYYCLAADADLAEAEPLVCASVPGISDPPGPNRIASLAEETLADLIVDSQLKRAHMAEIVIYLVLPGNNRDSGNVQAIFARLEARTGIEYRLENQFFASGRTGWFEAVAQAREALSQGEILRCIIVAVDSLLDNSTLGRLDEEGLLKSDRNLDGFIPGEGGAAILLESAETARARNACIRAVVCESVLAQEPNPPGSTVVCNGDGMLEVVSTGLTSLEPEDKITWMISDFNGELNRAREWGHCLVRLDARVNITHDLHPAEYIGDTGTASGAMAGVLAAQSWEVGLAPASHALILAASDGSTRAAMVLSAPT